VMPWRVTAFDRPERLALSYGKPFPMDATFSFQSTAEGTRVTCRTDLHPKGWWRLLTPVIAWEGKKTDRVQFDRVKAILESSDASAAAAPERSAT
jgi:hypothetical protein